MKCPTDDTVLMMTDRQGIEIDYCPECRGVWLDRGELDKLIDRSGEAPGRAPTPRPAQPPAQPPPTYDQRESSSGQTNAGYTRKRKKESFLGELFDF